MLNERGGRENGGLLAYSVYIYIYKMVRLLFLSLSFLPFPFSFSFLSPTPFFFSCFLTPPSPQQIPQRMSHFQQFPPLYFLLLLLMVFSFIKDVFPRRRRISFLKTKFCVCPSSVSLYHFLSPFPFPFSFSSLFSLLSPIDSPLFGSPLFFFIQLPSPSTSPIFPFALSSPSLLTIALRGVFIFSLILSFICHLY